MMKHQGQNTPMKMTQKKEKQTKPLHFTITQILPDDEIAEGINSLNSEQREVFNVVHTWVKDYLNYDRLNVETIHIFFSGRQKMHR